YRAGLRRAALPRRDGPPATAGRWSLLPPPESDPTVLAHARAWRLLDRYGVVTRGAVAAEGVPGGFAATYRILSALEDAGRVRRGYFVEALGAAQFALAATIDRLRAQAADAGPNEAEPRQGDAARPEPVLLAATDPANPFGAALPWPKPVGDGPETTHRPARKAGALVTLHDGAPGLYVERGGKSMLAFTDDEESLAAAARVLADAVRAHRVAAITVESVNGVPIAHTSAAQGFAGAGFTEVPRGLRMRP
ncbi:MAG TPA: ATP-dependent helicase, partial [Microbacteriaceae bacterium]|nr:ATP-dependent helicase [Microbacteriaceae bacterium]